MMPEHPRAASPTTETARSVRVAIPGSVRTRIADDCNANGRLDSNDVLIGASADANSNSIELSLLERGGNSDLRIRGIRADGSLTDAITMLRGQTGQAGWTLDSLEIDGPQQVHGVGISLDSSWTNIKGFRFEATDGMNGPDLIAVGTIPTNFIPTPGSLALIGAAGLIIARRRR